jgi:hypothetical protein
MGNSRYPLFQQVVTVSLKTMKIVRSLPSLDILTTAPAEQASQASPVCG